MLAAMLVVHVLICVFIIGVVLLQSSQQANLGGMFGGGASQTVFGSSTQTALGKATTVAAILFFVLCIGISFVIEKERSIIKMTESVRQEKIEEKVSPKEEGAAPGGQSAIPAAPASPQTPPPEQ